MAITIPLVTTTISGPEVRGKLVSQKPADDSRACTCKRIHTYQQICKGRKLILARSSGWRANQRASPHRVVFCFKADVTNAILKPILRCRSSREKLAHYMNYRRHSARRSPNTSGQKLPVQEQVLSYLEDEEDEDGLSVHIYRVPWYMRKIAAEDYNPQELSVGLYCHRSLDLRDPMQLDFSKLAVARKFCSGPEVSPSVNRLVRAQAWREFVDSFDDCLMAEASRMYDSIEDIDAESEKDVLILDSLFILAFLRFGYSFDDCWNYDFKPVFERSRFNAQRFPLLRDLLMLENQVPMGLLTQVVKYICNTQNLSSPESMLHDLLLWFVMQVYPFNHGVKLDVSTDDLRRYLEGHHLHGVDTFVKCKHLLECAYLAISGPHTSSADHASQRCGMSLPCFRPRNVGPGDSEPARNRFRIPSATSLKRVGITVKVRKDSLTLSNIKFVRQRHNLKYVLLVPKIIMNDHTASIFKNLALYEQIRDNGFWIRGDIRTYLYLMSSLVDTVQDVRLLMNQGVIVNQLSSADAVCKQWNQMCDGLFIPSSPPPYWTHIQDRIGELEKSTRHKWFAEIEEQNFSSLVLVIAFVAACIVFIATVLQAVFSVLSYV